LFYRLVDLFSSARRLLKLLDKHKLKEELIDAYEKKIHTYQDKSFFLTHLSTNDKCLFVVSLISLNNY